MCVCVCVVSCVGLSPKTDSEREREGRGERESASASFVSVRPVIIYDDNLSYRSLSQVKRNIYIFFFFLF